jgi:hypothetical protein
MDNPETLAILGTQDAGQRKTKQNTIQHRKLKQWGKTSGEPRWSSPHDKFNIGTYGENISKLFNSETELDQVKPL